MQEALEDIFENNIKYIKKKSDLLKNALVNVQRRKELFEKELKEIAKMQNLSQNEFNQITVITVIRDLSRDELEQILKVTRIKNYEDMKKEDLIISLLKSKESRAELFNDNHHDNKISDIRRIINTLKGILPKKHRKEIKDKIEHQRNISEEERERNHEYLRQLVRILNDKEKYGPGDRDDFDHYGIMDIPILFNETSKEDY